MSELIQLNLGMFNREDQKTNATHSLHLRLHISERLDSEDWKDKVTFLQENCCIRQKVRSIIRMTRNYDSSHQ